MIDCVVMCGTCVCVTSMCVITIETLQHPAVDVAWGIGKQAEFNHGVAEVRGRFSPEHVKAFASEFESRSIRKGTFLSGGQVPADSLDTLSTSTEGSYAMWCGPPPFNDFVKSTVAALGYGPRNSFEF